MCAEIRDAAPRLSLRTHDIRHVRMLGRARFYHAEKRTGRPRLASSSRILKARPLLALPPRSPRSEDHRKRRFRARSRPRESVPRIAPGRRCLLARAQNAMLGLATSSRETGGSPRRRLGKSRKNTSSGASSAAALTPPSWRASTASQESASRSRWSSSGRARRATRVRSRGSGTKC